MWLSFQGTGFFYHCYYAVLYSVLYNNTHGYFLSENIMLIYIYMRRLFGMVELQTSCYDICSYTENHRSTYPIVSHVYLIM